MTRIRTIFVAVLGLLATPAFSDEPASPVPSSPPPPAPAPALEESPLAVVKAAPSVENEHALMLGIRGGVTIPQAFNKLDTNFLVEVELAYQLPFLHHRFGIFADAGYTQPTESNTHADARVPSGMVTYSEIIRDVGFTLGVHYWQPVGHKVLVYGGVGARLHLTHTLISATSGGQFYGENTEDSTRIGAMVRLGAGYRIGPGAIVLELHMEYTPIDHLITGGERTGESANTANFAAQLGYQFFLL